MLLMDQLVKRPVQMNGFNYMMSMYSVRFTTKDPDK